MLFLKLYQSGLVKQIRKNMDCNAVATMLIEVQKQQNCSKQASVIVT